MTENIKKLYELISKDEKAREEITTCTEKEKLIDLAKKYDITLTEEDFNDLSNSKPQNLSEDEMAAVAGGKTCVCVVGGGGEASLDHQGICACPLVGDGFYDKRCWNNGIHGWWVTVSRCCCAIGGGGGDTNWQNDDDHDDPPFAADNNPESK